MRRAAKAAIWHEVECGGYAADLPVWEGLAADAAGPVLELGCGTGRVALRLAGRDREVWAVDADASLLEALQARASAQGLPCGPRAPTSALWISGAPSS